MDRKLTRLFAVQHGLITREALAAGLTPRMIDHRLVSGRIAAAGWDVVRGTPGNLSTVVDGATHLLLRAAA